MDVKNWHVGKLVILWAWGIVVIGIALQVLEKIKHFTTGFIVIGAIFVIPIVLSVITWKWLSGRE